jgi:hypothetical protein
MRLKTKIIIFSSIILGTHLLGDIFSPILNNELALIQFERGSESFWIQNLYYTLKSYKWFLFSLILYILFSKEIITFFKRNNKL